MKRFLKLADVCKQLDLPPYVLRYWETEFPALQGSGQSGSPRAFSLDEVALLRRIKQLLYDEGYTIAGAKKKLESEPAPRADSHPTLFATGTAESPAAAAAAPGGAPAALDSPTEQRIESLRRGVADALKEARAILALLDKSSR